MLRASPKAQCCTDMNSIRTVAKEYIGDYAQFITSKNLILKEFKKKNIKNVIFKI